MLFFKDHSLFIISSKGLGRIYDNVNGGVASWWISSMGGVSTGRVGNQRVQSVYYSNNSAIANYTALRWNFLCFPPNFGEPPYETLVTLGLLGESLETSFGRGLEYPNKKNRTSPLL